VGVEDLLERRLAVGVEQVDAVAAETARTEGGGHPPGHSEHAGTRLGVEVGQGGQVGTGDDQQVTGRHRADVEEGDDGVVLVDEGGGSVAADDRAEDAGRIGHRPHHVTSSGAGTCSTGVPW
jgi:hypothetical protein